MVDTVQHTIKLRLPINAENGRKNQIVDVNCPPFASIPQLDSWLAKFLADNPSTVVVSKSWSPHAPA